VDEWNANGYLICRSELTTPGSYKVSYLVSGEAGRSKPSDDVTYVDASETIYQYQAHAGKITPHHITPYHTTPYTTPYHIILNHKSSCYLDVVSVSPKTGSVAGGTVLTITGRFFAMEKKFVKVTVGGKNSNI
jgi:hypothetical protein